MSIDKLFSHFSYVFYPLALLAFVNVILAQCELLRLKRYRPDILLKAGIKKIDWWFQCLAGMLRLGFGGAGMELSFFERLIFKGIGFHYLWLLSLMLLTIFGVFTIEN